MRPGAFAAPKAAAAHSKCAACRLSELTADACVVCSVRCTVAAVAAALCALVRARRQRRHARCEQASQQAAKALDGSARHLLPKLIWEESHAAEAQELLREQLSRGHAFLGDEGHESLCSAFVVIVGLDSGVGGHAAHMLARGGVRALRLVGSSTVTRASLATDAVAVAKDVGRQSGAVLLESLRRTVPDVMVELLDAEWQEENPASSDREDQIAALAPLRSATPVPGEHPGESGRVRLVLDCLSDPAAKASLLAACALLGLRAITVGQVDGRADLTRWHTGALADALPSDPSLHSTRALLNKRTRALADARSLDVLAVYSSEMLPHTHPDSLGSWRAAVRGPLAAGVGQIVALAAIAAVTARQPPPQLPAKVARVVLRRLTTRLIARERRLYGTDAKQLVKMLPDETLELVCLTGWGMRCAITAEPLDSRACNVELVRRDKKLPASAGNLLLLAAHLAHAHDEAPEGTRIWTEADDKRIARICAALGGRRHSPLGPHAHPKVRSGLTDVVSD
mmetsp:Transcript_26891/g.62001  ORF Transcript_26891/g.62001 Transcript_26891/m.62001 type:complete len:513 (+) Transcript_26891:341-1879(+)